MILGLTTDMLVGGGAVAAVLWLVPGAWKWVKAEYVKVKSEVATATTPAGAAAVGQTVGTDLSKVVTAVDPKATALAASVKADAANIVSSVLRSL